VKNERTDGRYLFEIPVSFQRRKDCANAGAKDSAINEAFLKGGVLTEKVKENGLFSCGGFFHDAVATRAEKRVHRRLTSGRSWGFVLTHTSSLRRGKTSLSRTMSAPVVGEGERISKPKCFRQKRGAGTARGDLRTERSNSKKIATTKRSLP